MPHGSIREEIINSINKGIKNDVFSSYPGQHSGTTIQIVYPALHTQTNSNTNNVENNKVEYLKTTTKCDYTGWHRINRTIQPFN